MATYKAGSGFKKARTTFLNASGRAGAPSTRKPRVSKRGFRGSKITNGRVMAKKPAGKRIGRAATVPSARKIATGPARGVVNSFRMTKKAPMSSRGRSDNTSSNFYMSRKPAGRSATRSAQSTPMSMRPRG